MLGACLQTLFNVVQAALPVMGGSIIGVGQKPMFKESACLRVNAGCGGVDKLGLCKSRQPREVHMALVKGVVLGHKSRKHAAAKPSNIVDEHHCLGKQLLITKRWELFSR